MEVRFNSAFDFFCLDRLYSFKSNLVDCPE
jgi:hypothetical protein